MACLLDELWTKALQAAVCRGVLGHRDLCCLALTSRALNRLSGLATIWEPLFLRDFPQFLLSSSSPASLDYKSEYRARFEKIKAFKVAAHKRFEKIRASKVAAHKSQIFRHRIEQDVLENQMNSLEKRIQEERSKLSRVMVELQRLEQARRSSTALCLWQPEIVRSMQHQFVEQQPIDSEFRQHSLEMEAKLGEEEINGCIARMVQKLHALEKLKELEFMSYNPMQVLHEEPCGPTKRSKQQMKADEHKTFESYFTFRSSKRIR